MLFIAKKPEDTEEVPMWVPEMDKYDGQVVDLDVEGIDEEFYARLPFCTDGNRYWFNKKWLTPLPEKPDAENINTNQLEELI